MNVRHKQASSKARGGSQAGGSSRLAHAWHPLLCLGLVSAGVASAGPASAQRAPEPPPPHRSDEADRAWQLALPPGFVDSYAAAGSPRLAFFTHVVYVEGGARRALEESAVLSSLASRMEQRFVADPRVTVVEVGAAIVRERGEFDALARNDLYEAAKLLAREARADVVTLVVLTEQPRNAEGVLYNASYVVVDVNRGRRIGSHAFQITPGFDGYDPGRPGRLTQGRISDYATALARRFSEDFQRAYPRGGAIAGGRAYQLRIANVDALQVGRVRDALRTVPGVLGVGRSQFDEREGGTLASFDVTFIGEPIDLALRSSEKAGDALERHVSFRLAREGSLVLEVGGPAPARRTPAPSSPPPTAFLPPRQESPPPVEQSPPPPPPTVAPAAPPVQTPPPPATIQPSDPTLAELYARAGSPRIAVVVSRAAVRDSSTPGEGSPESNYTVIIAPRTNVNSVSAEASSTSVSSTDSASPDAAWRARERADDILVASREVEDQMLARLRGQGLRCVTLEEAWTAIERERVFATKSVGEYELALELGRRGNADIVISGVGAVARERARVSQLRYSYRAIRVRDGAILAATTVWREPEGPAWETAADKLGEARRSAASSATDRILASLAQEWAAPVVATLRISQVASFEDVSSLAQWLARNVPGISAARVRGFEVRTDGGIGFIELTCSSDFDAVIQALAQRSAGLRVDRVNSNLSEIDATLTSPPPRQ